MKKSIFNTCFFVIRVTDACKDYLQLFYTTVVLPFPSKSMLHRYLPFSKPIMCQCGFACLHVVQLGLVNSCKYHHSFVPTDQKSNKKLYQYLSSMYINLHGQIQIFLKGGTHTLFKEKNGSTWAPTHSFCHSFCIIYAACKV